MQGNFPSPWLVKKSRKRKRLKQILNLTIYMSKIKRRVYMRLWMIFDRHDICKAIVLLVKNCKAIVTNITQNGCHYTSKAPILKGNNNVK